MSGVVVKKCSYFNSGYCRYTKKEMGCKNYHPRDVCQLKECREKTCPDRHPKKCKFEDKCMFQSRCSYQHSKQTSKEQDKLQDEIKTLRAEIDQIKKDNNVKINTLAKVHLKELSDLKQGNGVLNKSINDLRAKLNSEELKESQEFSKTSNKADTESDINAMTKLNLTKYKCDHCSFEAKSTRGLKTHRGHMKKRRARVTIGGQCVLLQNSLKIKLFDFFQKAKITV